MRVLKFYVENKAIDILYSINKWALIRVMAFRWKEDKTLLKA